MAKIARKLSSWGLGYEWNCLIKEELYKQLWILTVIYSFHCALSMVFFLFSLTSAYFSPRLCVVRKKLWYYSSLYFSKFFSASEEMLSGEGKRHGKLTYRYSWLYKTSLRVKKKWILRENEIYTNFIFLAVVFFLPNAPLIAHHRGWGKIHLLPLETFFNYKK